MNGTDKYIETVKYLSRLYHFMNEKLFNGEFERPVITVQRDERNKTNGWWSVKKVWKWQDNASVVCEEHELNMTAQQLNRPINEIVATLIHEMCHQYASVNNLQDTSRSGNYHNKLFKKIAEEHGLTVGCLPTIGWSHTELKPETAQLVAEFANDNPETLIYRAPVMKGQSVKTSSTRKYICPCCGMSVRATKAVNILCADCNEVMLED